MEKRNILVIGTLDSMPLDFPIEDNIIMTSKYEEGKEYDMVICIEEIKKHYKIKVRRGCTLLISGKFPTPEIISTDFLNQFNYLSTYRDDLLVRFRGAKVFRNHYLDSWTLGQGSEMSPNHPRPYSTITTYKPFKNFDLSMIVSNKENTELQKARYRFAQVIHQTFSSSGKFQIYGRGVREIPDTAIALDNFRFSICMESIEANDYFTNRLINCILSETIPLYWGCPNIEEYFSILKNPLLRLDPYDMRSSIQKISFILQNSENLYNSFREQLLQDKKAYLEKYHKVKVMSNMSNEIMNSYDAIYGKNKEIEEKIISPNQFK